MKISRLTALTTVTLLLLGCTVGPDYEKPKTDLPDAWLSGETGHQEACAIQQDWWENFHDPVLSELINKAAAGNFDLQIAEARIAQARASRSAADAGLWPTGDFKASATREANQFAFPGNLPGLTEPFDIFQTGFDASWELDLFGAHRRDIEGANASLQASRASRDDVIVSLMAEVARTYIDIRQYQAQLALTQSTINSDTATINIARQRFNAGSAPGIDVTQADAQLQAAMAQLPYYRSLLAQAEFSMDVLLGQNPGATQAIITDVKPIPSAPGRFVLAAPSSVIANRPDIRMAERQLAAATAQQGVAVAKFFPDISLSGFVGFLNTNAGSVLTAGSESWMGGANLIWPILSYGTLSANLDAANAQQQEALATYRKSMISALSDVEKSVTAYTEQQAFLQSLRKSVEANRSAAAVSEERYKGGLTSFLEVLDARRTLYASQVQLTEAEAKSSQDLVAVYKSLGGGWKAGLHTAKAARP